MSRACLSGSPLQRSRGAVLIHQSGSPSASHMHAWPLKLLRLASATSAAVCVGTRIHGPAGCRRSAVAAVVAVVAVVAVAQRRRHLIADGAVGLIALPSPSQHRGARHGLTWLDMAWTRHRSAPRSLPTRGCQASGPVACGSAARQSPKAHLAYPTSPPYTTTCASPDRPRSSRCGERAACPSAHPPAPRQNRSSHTTARFSSEKKARLQHLLP
jgi:hypothetical protein